MTDTNNDTGFPEGIFESPGFLLGSKLGSAHGRQDAIQEANNARAAGELDLWLDYSTPKTKEGWKAWESEHGNIEDFRTRWGRKLD